MTTDKDTVQLQQIDKGNGPIIQVTDECGEEVARYGTGGDLLSAFPGLDQTELECMGWMVSLGSSELAMGKVLFHEMTPA